MAVLGCNIVFGFFIDYTNSSYQQSGMYGAYPQVSQQTTMNTSYPSVVGTTVYSASSTAPAYANAQQPVSTATYSAGQTATGYGMPPNPPVASYAGYPAPVATGTVGATAPPPPPVVGTDGGQYGIRPPSQQGTGEV